MWDECEAWDEQRRQQRLPYDPDMYGIKQLYPSLSRDTSAKILSMIARTSLTDSEGGDNAESRPEATDSNKKIPVKLELEFANDGMFCEWAYVIDLDKEVLEVYGGCEKKRDGHRFQDVGGEHDEVPAFYCSLEFRELYLMKSDMEFLESARKAHKEQVGTTEASDEEEDPDDETEEDPDDETEEDPDNETEDDVVHSTEGSPVPEVPITV
jgi:flagellar motor switch/type III secretory pathway protein FliN